MQRPTRSDASTVSGSTSRSGDWACSGRAGSPWPGRRSGRRTRPTGGSPGSTRRPGTVAERVRALARPRPAAAVDSAGGVHPDRWASAWGFAIDGDSIFVPSIAAAAGRRGRPERRAAASSGGSTPASGQPPSWISIDRPTGVAVGFGSVWVVSCCGDHSDARTYSIVRLEKETGGVQASITLPAPEAEADGRPVVRVGPDSVWVGLTDLPLVVRIDPATNSIRSTLPVDLPVSDLAVGDDGSLWLTESEAVVPLRRRRCPIDATGTSSGSIRPPSARSPRPRWPVRCRSRSPATTCGSVPRAPKGACSAAKLPASSTCGCRRGVARSREPATGRPPAV